MKITLNASTSGKIPYQLVSMAAILRDYIDPEYANQEHRYLTGIADYLYNATISRNPGKESENLLPEYKAVYDKYGRDYFEKVLDDMYAIDGQLTGEGKERELFEDYMDRLQGITASKKIKASKERSFDYMLLDRLRSDCDYVLNTYDRPEAPGDIPKSERELAEKFLWAGNVKDQIAKMREIYDRLQEKPEWLTREDIDEYARRFKEAQIGKGRRSNVASSKKMHRKIKATEDFSYNQHLVKIAGKDKRYVLDNLNSTHKTLGRFGEPGDPGYYVSEFEDAYGGYLWASDKGMKILEDSDVDYEEVKPAVEGSTKIKASYADDLDAVDGGSDEYDPGNIYEVAVKLLPAEDIAHHYSDLYIRKTPESTAMLKKMRYRNSGLLTTFRSQIDGDIWYELPFCYGFERARQEQQKANADMADFLKNRYNK